ncbi:hypothetical protein CPSG_02941 [Coccidioides posadasii str. Silveira]|uniref:Uncharacterized protein n=1 Tax=Coccidioides posadasii (strain RMSCC 757 / Silveira) TaxID=443226 RepID=E9CYS1_COCPS|nr:hypothetical protein CPSG_02941 [Coccidioides posadasii str. Silveira]
MTHSRRLVCGCGVSIVPQVLCTRSHFRWKRWNCRQRVVPEHTLHSASRPGKFVYARAGEFTNLSKPEDQPPFLTPPEVPGSSLRN